MTAYNVAISRIDIPARMLKLRVDARGYPVPRFVKWIDGVPDFRVIDGKWMAKAMQADLCWLCGEPLGRHKAFVIGPMCAVNRVTSEPPSHLDCARFAVKACPFLTQPKRGRNDDALPEHAAPSGMIERNPGVSLIWVTDKYTLFSHGGSQLIRVGPASLTEWWARARRATRDEVVASIVTGLPALRAAAKKDGVDSATIDADVMAAMELLPHE